MEFMKFLHVKDVLPSDRRNVETSCEPCAHTADFRLQIVDSALYTVEEGLDLDVLLENSMVTRCVRDRR